MIERVRVAGVARTDVLVAAPLDGRRTIHQAAHLRPRCPHCGARLDPGRVLSGWSPGPRRRHHWCLECDTPWSVVDNPGALVDALARYWLARNGLGDVTLADARERLAGLHVPVPG